MDLIEWQKQEFTGLNPGLKRIKKFIAAAGHPEKRFPAVHIAGTNGKGSTSRMIATILKGAGYTTGLFTSPHLVAVEERVQINSVPVSRPYLNGLSRQYESLAHRCSLSFFEYITGLALIVFAREKVDIAVIETGLGGRYDATNVVPSPLAAVITEIDYDHMNYLGDTLTDIAREKAGIIKPGTTVVCGVHRPAARKVIATVAHARGTQIYFIEKDFLSNGYSPTRDGRGHTGTYRGIERTFTYAVPLTGFHQSQNTAVALAAIEMLSNKGYRIPTAGIQRSLKTVEWHGRFSVLRRTNSTNRIIVDGAHNPSGMRTLIKTLSEKPWKKSRITFITGILKDKAYRPIAAMIGSRASRVIVVPVASERTLEPGLMASLIHKAAPGVVIETVPTLKEAITCTRKERVTVISGSLYLAGEFYKELKKKFNI